MNARPSAPAPEPAGDTPAGPAPANAGTAATTDSAGTADAAATTDQPDAEAADDADPPMNRAARRGRAQAPATGGAGPHQTVGRSRAAQGRRVRPKRRAG